MVLRTVIIVAIAIAAVLALAVLLASAKPSTIRVEFGTIDAAPEKIFPLTSMQALSAHNCPATIWPRFVTAACCPLVPILI